MSPFKYILHSLRRQGQIVKKQPARVVHQSEEPSDENTYFLTFPAKEPVTMNNGLF